MKNILNEDIRTIGEVRQAIADIKKLIKLRDEQFILQLADLEDYIRDPRVSLNRSKKYAKQVDDFKDTLASITELNSQLNKDNFGRFIVDEQGDEIADNILDELNNLIKILDSANTITDRKKTNTVANNVNFEDALRTVELYTKYRDELNNLIEEHFLGDTDENNLSQLLSILNSIEGLEALTSADDEQFINILKNNPDNAQTLIDRYKELKSYTELIDDISGTTEYVENDWDKAFNDALTFEQREAIVDKFLASEEVWKNIDLEKLKALRTFLYTEFLYLGFNEETNPFITYLKNVLPTISIPAPIYEVIHNLYVKDVISANDLKFNSSNEKLIAALKSPLLYRLDAKKAENYLKSLGKKSKLTQNQTPVITRSTLEEYDINVTNYKDLMAGINYIINRDNKEQYNKVVDSYKLPQPNDALIANLGIKDFISDFKINKENVSKALKAIWVVFNK